MLFLNMSSRKPRISPIMPSTMRSVMQNTKAMMKFSNMYFSIIFII